MNTVRTQSEQHIRPAPTAQVDHDPGGSSYGNALLSKQPSGLPTGDSRKNHCPKWNSSAPNSWVWSTTPTFSQFTIHRATTIFGHSIDVFAILPRTSIGFWSTPIQKPPLVEVFEGHDGTCTLHEPSCLMVIAMISSKCSLKETHWSRRVAEPHWAHGLPGQRIQRPGRETPEVVALEKLNAANFSLDMMFHTFVRKHIETSETYQKFPQSSKLVYKHHQNPLTIESYRHICHEMFISICTDCGNPYSFLLLPSRDASDLFTAEIMSWGRLTPQIV